MTKTKTKKDYEEWKGYILQLYSHKQRIVDAVWNDIISIAETDGLDEFMTYDEEDMVNAISEIVTNVEDGQII